MAVHTSSFVASFYCSSLKCLESRLEEEHLNQGTNPELPEMTSPPPTSICIMNALYNSHPRLNLQYCVAHV